MILSPRDEEDWVRVEQVFETATLRGRYLGQIDLVRQKQWQRFYQANTVRTEKVLSSFFPGLEVIKHGVDDFLRREFSAVIKQLRLQHKVACGYARFCGDRSASVHFLPLP